MNIKIVFVGTSDFGIPSLRALKESRDVDIKLVITREDKPKGRGLEILPPPIKIEAGNLGIDILQPPSINDDETIQRIKSIRPDYIVVVAYGEKLSTEVLSLPKKGSINLHASLLPELRGAAPINWAIIRGYKKTGVTTMLMSEKIDAGEILLQCETNISADENAEMLHNRLSHIGADILPSTIIGHFKGRIKPRPQEIERVSYAPKILKEHCKINWEETDGIIHNLIRGLSPKPLAFTYLDDILVKIVKSRLSDAEKSGEPGEILNITKEGALVSTGARPILVTELQIAGKRIMTPYQLLQGRQIKSGQRFY